MEEEQREWMRIEQLRQIDMEELEIEEVDEADISSSEDESSNFNRGSTGNDESGDIIIYNSCLVSIDSYLDDVTSNQNLTCLDAGPILNLPMFYTQVVLLPEAILPMTVTITRFKASLGKALKQTDVPCTVGVVYVNKDPCNQKLHFSSVGTTAEIQQHCLLENGSFNVLLRGKQRFHLRHHWIDEDGAPCAAFQFIHEDLPLRMPRDAFAESASVNNIWNYSSSCQVPPDISHAGYGGGNKQNNGTECSSDTSFENDLDPEELQLHQSAIKFCKRYDGSDISGNSYRSPSVCESEKGLKGSSDYASGTSSEHSSDAWSRNGSAGLGNHYMPVTEQVFDNYGQSKLFAAAQSKLSRRASRSFWPHWVYQMFDSFCLAQRAIVMWMQIMGDVSVNDLAKKPERLSFHIARKIPVSESLRQELLEINGVSYRLRREIEMLECFDLVHCKTCQSATARRSEMLVMSSDGPLGAYANTDHYVHETKAFCKVTGVTLIGCPSEDCSWFPGYAWTVAKCSICKSVMGWLFTAVNKILKPDSFWAIRTSQIAETFVIP